MNKNWLNRLSWKYGRYAIRNLMLYIVIGQAVVFCFGFIMSATGLNIYSMLSFSTPDIMRGQVWRLISFIFIPPSSSILFAVLAMYFSWLMGSALENEWGSFKFNLFYLTGVILTIIGGLFTWFTTGIYLNLSLFFAFAAVYPGFQILLFFVIPIKAKYLALLYAVFLIFSLITSGLGDRVAILASVLNLLLYFGPQLLDRTRQINRRSQWRRRFR